MVEEVKMIIIRLGWVILFLGRELGITAAGNGFTFVQNMLFVHFIILISIFFIFLIMHSIKSGCCWSGTGRGWRWHGWRNIYRLCESLIVSFWKHSLPELCFCRLLFQLLFHVMLAHFSGIKMPPCAAATKSIYWTSTPRSCCGDIFLVCSAATWANLWSKN